jgi:hypothetical protein
MIARQGREQAAALQDFNPGNVRFGSKADTSRHLAYVRFTPESGHSAKASVQPESRSLVRLSYATEVRFVAATALLPMLRRSFNTSFTRPWLTS